MRQDSSKTDAILKDGDTSKTQSKMLSLRRGIKDRSFKDKDVKDKFSKTKTAKMPFQRQRCFGHFPDVSTSLLYKHLSCLLLQRLR